MSESEDLQAQARISLSVVQEALAIARKLRKKAEDLEKEARHVEAQAAREFAEYMEGVADSQGCH